MREQIEILKHHRNIFPDVANISYLRVQADAIDNDLALFVRFKSVEAAN